MSCEEVEELAGAYALGALPEEERAAVSAHLESCDKHPEIGELQAAAASLALAAPEIEPPAELKSRLMDAISGKSPPKREVIPPRQSRRSIGDAIRSWFSRPQLGYGLAGALAVLVVGLVAWNISLQGDDSDRTVLTVSGGAAGRVIYLASEKLAVLDVHNLEPLPAGKVYEVWAMTGTSATPAGLLEVADDGSSITSMPFDANGVEQLGVTVEDAPGVDQPTSAPVFTARFS